MRKPLSDPFGDVARPSRRQRRLVNFLAPQLRANEQIEIIVSAVHEEASLSPTALVLTTERLLELRLEFLTARPKALLAEHSRTSVTAEWDRYAKTVGASGLNPRLEVGTLSITDMRVTKTFWVHGERRKDRAQAIAAGLDADRN